MIAFLESILNSFIEFGILLLEFIGVCIIIYTSLVSLYKYIAHRSDLKIYLANGLAIGLEFKLGSEILRTVLVQRWEEIAIVAGIILLRAALTFLIHWEIREEEKEKKAEGN